jgi:hypothetical protein
MQKSQKLYTIYQDIQNCHLCSAMDREKSLRLLDAVSSHSDVFIISQALAENQLRKSGVNFFQADGSLGSTGASLEGFLNKFNRTVYPGQEVKISDTVTIPHSDPHYKPVYNTEIAQCYPGKNTAKKGDRKPTGDEIQTCIRQGFLMQEITLIQPKLLLLMGKASRDSFFDYFLKAGYPQSLTSHLSEITRAGNIPECSLGNSSAYVLPIQHASGLNPRFPSMMNDKRLVDLIKGVLE